MGGLLRGHGSIGSFKEKSATLRGVLLLGRSAEEEVEGVLGTVYRKHHACSPKEDATAQSGFIIVCDVLVVLLERVFRSVQAIQGFGDLQADVWSFRRGRVERNGVLKERDPLLRRGRVFTENLPESYRGLSAQGFLPRHAKSLAGVRLTRLGRCVQLHRREGETRLNRSGESLLREHLLKAFHGGGAFIGFGKDARQSQGAIEEDAPAGSLFGSLQECRTRLPVGEVLHPEPCILCPHALLRSASGVHLGEPLGGANLLPEREVSAKGETQCCHAPLVLQRGMRRGVGLLHLRIVLHAVVCRQLIGEPVVGREVGTRLNLL